MNIVVLDGIGLNPGDLSFDELKKYGNLTVFNKTDDKDIVERSKDADALFIVYANMTREIIEKLPKLKYIGVLSTGFDNIDIKACSDNNILVTNVPTYGTDAVAQFSLALLLEITSRVAHHDREVKNGRWSKVGFWAFGDYPLIELSGKTVGIIGLGKIGLAAAKIYKAMGMKVLAYNRSKKEEAKNIVEYVSLDELYKKSDVIDLHIPLTDETADIINKKSIEKMKDGVIIINTSRGGLINEEDLIEAVKSRKVYGAGLDVVKIEPINDDNPLLKYDNIIITPHMAWGPKEPRQRLLDTAIENFEAFLEGKEVNKVN